MDREPQRENDADGSESTTPKKKLYQAPEILYRQPIEAVAAVCGPPGGKSALPMCSVGPITS